MSDHSSTTPLVTILADMKEELNDIVRWGAIVRSLGASGDPIDSGDIIVIGRAVESLGMSLFAQWKEARATAVAGEAGREKA